MSKRNSRPAAELGPCPTFEQALLLRACLWSGRPALRAWEDWQERVGNVLETIKQGSGGIKRLLPLLLGAVQRNALVVEPSLLTRLKTAYLREQLRNRIYWQVC